MQLERGMKHTLLEEDILAANTYMPILEKERVAALIANGSINQINLAIKTAAGTEAIPAIYSADFSRRQRCMLGALLKFYLKKEFSPARENEFLMSADEYDEWARCHIANQLERLKQNAKVRERVFCLLDDYRELERRVNAEIKDMLAAQNDLCVRLYQMVMRQTEPEEVKRKLERIKELQGELYEAQKKRGVKK